MTRLVILLCALCFGTTGCGSKEKVLGRKPNGVPSSVLAVYAGDTPSTPVLKGVMVEKCPTAGCWFRLKDDTGEIKVDTKSAGFVVTSIPLNTRVTVAGKIISSGDGSELEATGLSY